MITNDVAEFAAALPPMTSVAGLDFGDKTIGVAISDRLRTVATPTDTIRRKKFTLDAEALLKLLTSREVSGIILGLPRNMDGTEGPRCQKTRAFARNLGQLTDLPITFWDERLSSVAADRAMLEADMSRAKRAAKIDQVAASVILQGALDRLRNL
ncbi:Holliday junction resolvase RuvX [Celeribacter halophilus]|uniref:Putative pre-16S rRNA nuclease n=1 Tax=Celeribacter halophilus TaxID=576117 RepID=A0AAW7XSM6_9RHOB|nr:Holliday junction resolvase RuvX [Celeribacter halophilus]MBU2890423.1 Holliday junction resolvase RuvX [Celeribacter halophilus]MDO6455843.1 Holliday junction resolvase RuvX [Celeribacter halophilus]MDO6511496.1 Holliday junction resolvase RuvX [Celeribacter halophilus]MDO6722032.1 Holliday junction resolvase RuvX [Celeribacter halophilus]